MEPNSDSSHLEPVTITGQVPHVPSTEPASFLVPSPEMPARPDPSSFTGPGAAASGSTKPDIAKPKASLDAPFNGVMQPASNAVVSQGSLLDDVSASMPDEVIPEPPKPVSRRRVIGLGLVAFGLLAGLLLGVRVELNKSHDQEARLESPSAQLKSQQLSTTSISKQLGTTQSANAVTVNGQLQVSSSLVLQPSTLTGPAVTGQMYYDAATNTLAYYNGKQYVSLQGGGNTFITNVTNNAGNTTNITNVTNVSGGGFTGTGTPGTLAMFNSATTLGNSLITESGTTLNVGAASGANATNVQGGTGGISISTQTVDGSSGAISIASGGSNTGGAGNVSVDTGPGVVTGTPVGSKTFEGGTDNMAPGFGYSDTLTQSATQAHGGTHSLAVTVGPDPVNSPNSWSVIDQTPYYAYHVTPGHKYVFSAWVRAGSNASTITFYADFSSTGYLGGGEVAQDLIGTITDSSGSWKQVTGIIKAPNGANDVLWELHATSTVLGEIHYLDDMNITDMNGSTGSSELNLGADNAQSVTLGNDFEVGQTSIKGGSGIALNSGQSSTTVNAEEFDVTSLNGINMDSGKGNVNITTSASNVVSGSIVVQSGNSSTTASGDVTVDTGAGFVSGAVTSSFTFEDNTTDGVSAWFGDTIAPTNTASHSGTYCLAMTTTGAFWGIILNGNIVTMPVTAGHHVFFSAWVRAATTPRIIGGQIAWNIGGTANMTSVTDSTSGWTQMSVSATVPAGATSATFDFSGGSTTAGETHYFDDITLTDLSSSSSTSSLNLGSTNAQIVNIGNMNELAATTIDGGSGITLNAGSGPLTVTAGAVSISGTAASAIGTSSGSLTLNSGGGVGGGVLVKPQSASTTAFQVQGVNVNLLTVDSTNNAISLGTGAGSSFGNAKIGPFNNGGAGGPLAMNASKFTTNAGGTVTSMSAYITGSAASPNNKFQFAIYSDNGGAPGSYIASSSVGTLTLTAAWNTLPITATLSPSTTYWLVYWQNDSFNDSSNGNAYFAGISGAVTYQQNNVAWQSGPDNGMPATFPTAGASVWTGNLRSIYASFSSSGPAMTFDQYGTMKQSGAALFQDPTDSTQAFQVENSLSTVLLGVDTADMKITIGGDLSVSGNITVNGHIVTGGNTPTIAAGAAACTTPTVSISGNDTSGTITVATGTGCAGGGRLATITFSSAFGAAPHITLTPDNANAQTLGDYVDGSTTSATGFNIGTTNTPANSTTYLWNYQVLQ